MTAMQQIISRAYNSLLRLYPNTYRSLFADEMSIVFQMKLADSQRAEPLPLFVCKEFSGLCRGIAIAHLQERNIQAKIWLGGDLPIFEISANEVSPLLRTLLRTDFPQTPRCLGVLEGNARAGRVLCDNPLRPTWAVVQESYDGTIYWGGKVTQSTLTSVVDTLRMKSDVIIGVWLDEPHEALLPANPDYDGRTLEFYDRPIGKGLAPYFAHLPEGYALRRMDRELVMRTEWGPQDVEQMGGLDAWEKECFGFCLMHKDEILCEASVGPSAQGLYEPGVFTQEAHRSKGYATLTAARLIQEIEARGGQTYWNCAKQNIASAKVARKLGYRVEREYRCLAWNQIAHN